MTNLREAAQQALEAMGTIGADFICDVSHHAKKNQHNFGEPCPLQQRWHVAYQALRAALEQPDPKPVAFAYYWPPTNTLRRNPAYQLEWGPTTVWKDEIPLYTHPPRREWQGLTDEEVLLCLKWDVSAEFLMIVGMPAKLLKEAKQEALEKYRAIEAALKEKNNG